MSEDFCDTDRIGSTYKAPLKTCRVSIWQHRVPPISTDVHTFWWTYRNFSIPITISSKDVHRMPDGVRGTTVLIRRRQRPEKPHFCFFLCNVILQFFFLPLPSFIQSMSKLFDRNVCRSMFGCYSKVFFHPCGLINEVLKKESCLKALCVLKDRCIYFLTGSNC